jgi:hypothetical protein
MSRPREVVGEVAMLPGLRVALGERVLDPLGRDDFRGAGHAAIGDELADAGEVAQGDAHAAGRTRCAEPVYGDVGGRACAHRLPQVFGHQVGIAGAGGAFDDPGGKVGVG